MRLNTSSPQIKRSSLQKFIMFGKVEGKKKRTISSKLNGLDYSTIDAPLE